MPSDSPQTRSFVIAIDGPGGAGKSTVSRAAARRLGVCYVDTGALYRAVTLAALEEGIPPEQGEALAALIRRMDLRFVDEEGGQRLLMKGRDVTRAVRDPRVSDAVSRYAALPQVRQALVELMQKLGRQGPVVMEGRDIGTVVFPQADLKIYLDASDEVRARRRLDELLAKGIDTTYEETLAALRRRDELDRSRAAAPLRQADDAVYLDTTGLTQDQVVERIVDLARSRGLAPTRAPAGP